MLVLLPPSEGKAAPARGKRLALHELEFPELTDARGEVLASLVHLCGSGASPRTPLHDQLRIEHAMATLGLGPTQVAEINANGRLLTAPTARADRVYDGVLYDALDLASLDGPARRRATRWLAITSALFGLLRPNDAIPAYRLSGTVSLPGVGGVAAHWREHLDPAVRSAANGGLIVDLRSTTYASFWRPAADLSPQVALLRILHEVDGQLKVVSHFNKATKGRLVRDLLQDGGQPDTPQDLADHLGDLGWTVKPRYAGRNGHKIDVIVEEL